MPYSELHQISKGNLESAQSKQTNCSADLAFVPDNEFVELVWENGQIMMQGQSSKSRKSPSSAASFMSHISKSQEKNEVDAVTPKFDKFGTADSVLNDFSSSGPSGHMEDDLVRWLNYPLDDDCSDFFSELSGDNLNALPPQINAVPTKGSSCGQILRDSVHGGANPEQRTTTAKLSGEPPDSTKLRSSQLRSAPLQQFQTSVPSPRSRVSEFTGTNSSSAHHAPCWNSTQNLNFNNTKMEKQDTGPPTKPPPHPSNNNTGFLNFSHFLRPTLKTNVQNQSSGHAAAPAPLSSIIDKFRSNDKASVMGSSNGVESTVIELTSGSRSSTGYPSQPVHIGGKLDVMPPIVKSFSKEPTINRHSEAICQEDAFVKNRSFDQAVGQTSSFSASIAIGRPDSEKATETVVASSSVCSGNSAGGASNDPKHSSKRKCRDTEESDYPSEDVEEESVAAKKPANGRGSASTKRSRAAEVHNLSERKRRDRINEKMRALQELIPNCNKVDKASMLDEAIEYLKTLQLQVQIMSMGTGLCMPPMMLPPGMQRLHAPHMGPFSPMGVGMGMGVGFGMGMLDMGGGSSSCPLIQMPPMHGPQFSCAPISGPSSMPMMTGSSPQMFGLPGQGLPMPRPPFIHMPGAPSTKPAPSPVVSGPANVQEVRDSPLHPSSKDEIENLNLQQMPKTSTQFSEDEIAATQCQVRKEGFEQSAMVQKLDQNPHNGSN